MRIFGIAETARGRGVDQSNEICSSDFHTFFTSCFGGPARGWSKGLPTSLP